MLNAADVPGTDVVGETPPPPALPPLAPAAAALIQRLCSLGLAWCAACAAAC